MEVILLEKVQRLGGLGDKVSVKAGYARNYLIPKGIAVAATPRNVADFEARREELERREAEALAAAGGRAVALEGVENHGASQGGGGRPAVRFGGTGGHRGRARRSRPRNFAQEVRMPDGDTIRQVGEYDVVIHIGPDVEATIRLKVEPEPAVG